MRCPRCGSSALKVAVLFTGEVYCDFADESGFRVLDSAHLDSAFAETDDCRCPECNWEGTLKEANTSREAGRSTEGAQQHIGALDDIELQRMRSLVPKMPKRQRRFVLRLIAEVDRLRSLLESVSRLTGSSDSGQDTTVG